MKTSRSTGELLDLLASRGLAATTQRLALLAAVLDSHDRHLSAEDLYRELSEQFPTLSRATIYNNLAALGNAGLIEKLGTPEGSRYGPVTRPHVNLLCTACGSISDVLIGDTDLERLIERATRAGDFVARSVSLSVSGLCRACAAAPA
jgi:Fe2+ or Zn2+ uptake regulation protein